MYFMYTTMGHEMLVNLTMPLFVHMHSLRRPRSHRVTSIILQNLDAAVYDIEGESGGHSP